MSANLRRALAQAKPKMAPQPPPAAAADADGFPDFELPQCHLCMLEDPCNEEMAKPKGSWTSLLVHYKNKHDMKKAFLNRTHIGIKAMMEMGEKPDITELECKWVGLSDDETKFKCLGCGAVLSKKTARTHFFSKAHTEAGLLQDEVKCWVVVKDGAKLREGNPHLMHLSWALGMGGSTSACAPCGASDGDAGDGAGGCAAVHVGDEGASEEGPNNEQSDAPCLAPVDELQLVQATQDLAVLADQVWTGLVDVNEATATAANIFKLLSSSDHVDNSAEVVPSQALDNQLLCCNAHGKDGDPELASTTAGIAGLTASGGVVGNQQHHQLQQQQQQHQPLDTSVGQPSNASALATMTQEITRMAQAFTQVAARIPGCNVAVEKPEPTVGLSEMCKQWVEPQQNKRAPKFPEVKLDWELQGSFKQYLKSRCLKDNSNQIYELGVQRFLGLLDISPNPDGKQWDHRTLFSALSKTQTIEEMMSTQLLQPGKAWSQSMMQGVKHYARHLLNMCLKNRKDWDSERADLECFIDVCMIHWIKGSQSNKHKAKVAKSFLTSKELKHFAPPEQCKLAVSRAMMCLELIAAEAEQTGVLTPAAHAQANRCITGILFLNGFCGRSGEFKLFTEDEVLKAIHEGAEVLLCPEHKTADVYGELAKYIWPGTWEAIKRYLGLPFPKHDCSEGADNTTAKKALFLKPVRPAAEFPVHSYLASFSKQFLDPLSPPGYKYTTCGVNMIRKLYHTKLNDIRRLGKAVELISKYDGHRASTAHQHYIINDAEQDTALGKLLFENLMGEAVAWPSHSDVMQQQAGIASLIAEGKMEEDDNSLDQDISFEQVLVFVPMGGVTQQGLLTLQDGSMANPGVAMSQHEERHACVGHPVAKGKVEKGIARAHADPLPLQDAVAGPPNVEKKEQKKRKGASGDGEEPAKLTKYYRMTKEEHKWIYYQHLVYIQTPEGCVNVNADGAATTAWFTEAWVRGIHELGVLSQNCTVSGLRSHVRDVMSGKKQPP